MEPRSTPLDCERWNVGCLAGFGEISLGCDEAPTTEGTPTAIAVAAIKMKRVSLFVGLTVIVIGTFVRVLERLLAQHTLRRIQR